jgi:OmpA-OmpF porin, OOP family
VLKPEATRQLGVVLQALRKQPTLKTHIVGHTDSVGTPAYNLKLSQRRAEAVAPYLAQQGVIRQNISTAWKGETEPVASNATAESRAQKISPAISPMPLTAS